MSLVAEQSRAEQRRAPRTMRNRDNRGIGSVEGECCDALIGLPEQATLILPPTTLSSSVTIFLSFFPFSPPPLYTVRYCIQSNRTRTTAITLWFAPGCIRSVLYIALGVYGLSKPKQTDCRQQIREFERITVTLRYQINTRFPKSH